MRRSYFGVLVRYNCAHLFCRGSNNTLGTIIINDFHIPLQDIKTKNAVDLSGINGPMGVEAAMMIAALVALNVRCHVEYSFA